MKIKLLHNSGYFLPESCLGKEYVVRKPDKDGCVYMTGKQFIRAGANPDWFKADHNYCLMSSGYEIINK